MSGEETTLAEGENSVTGTPAAEENFEQRFKDTQAALTQKAQALKDLESVWDDEDALVAKIAEKFPHLVEEPEFEDEDFVPGNTPPEGEDDPRFKQLDERLQAQELVEAERQYEKDLAGLLGDREVGEKGRKFIRAACALNGDNYKALEGAVNEFFELLPEDAPKKNKVPAVVASGQSVKSDVPDYDNMSQSERWEAMTARARALGNQTT